MPRLYDERLTALRLPSLTLSRWERESEPRQRGGCVSAVGPRRDPSAVCANNHRDNFLLVLASRTVRSGCRLISVTEPGVAGSLEVPDTVVSTLFLSVRPLRALRRRVRADS